MADLFEIGNEEGRPLGGSDTAVPKRLDRGESTCDAGLVVEEAAANEAGLVLLDAWIEMPEVTGLYPEQAPLSRGRGSLVEPYFERVGVALHGRRLLVDMPSTIGENQGAAPPPL